MGMIEISTGIDINFMKIEVKEQDIAIFISVKM